MDIKGSNRKIVFNLFPNYIKKNKKEKKL